MVKAFGCALTQEMLLLETQSLLDFTIIYSGRVLTF